LDKEIVSHKLACVIAQILDDKLAKDITILNISHVSSLADYFVIASGDSTPQVKALMETVKDKVKKHFTRLPLRNENDQKNRWNLLDYGEVVIHIMNQEQRDTYKIEKFWSHALTMERETWEELSQEFAQYD
jgi:ribosome-associated protein